jgi:multidrug efflux pump subunit AcrB
MAVIGSTGVLLFAFLPLANLPEGAGDFTRSLPMAVLGTVAASLAGLLTIVPFLASRSCKPAMKARKATASCRVNGGIERFYRPSCTGRWTVRAGPSGGQWRPAWSCSPPCR